MRENIYKSFNSFYESLLLEDIQSVKNQYPTIEDEKFDELIRLDPTFNESSNSVGTYGKWILNLYKKNKLDNIGHVNDLLTRFDENKKFLKNKDINSFKSMEDLDTYLNDDNNYNQASHRQLVRSRQDDRRKADVSSDLVLSGKNFDVYVPSSYANSCKLGAGTSWCTASTESDYYYNSYKLEYGGDYYIFIDKKNKNNKFQFHFESELFMNKDDERIDVLLFFLANPDLFKLFRNIKYGGLDIIKDIVKNEESFNQFNFVNLTHAGAFISDNKNNYLYKIKPYNYEDDSVRRVDIYFNFIKFYSLNLYQCIITHKDLLGLFDHLQFSNLIDRDVLNNATQVYNSTFIVEQSDSGSTKIIDTQTKKLILSNDYCKYVKSLIFSGNCPNIRNVSRVFPLVEHVVLLGGITHINYDAFNDCGRLKSIDIPDSVTSIGEFAFRLCNSLQSINIPDSVLYIKGCAFSDCVSLKSINIPDSVTKIGDSAFYNCQSLESINIPDGVTKIEDGTFCNCKSLKSIKIPDGVTEIGDSAFEECTLLESIVIPDNVTYIGIDAFNGCEKLKSINIPDGVTKIEDGTFCWCKKLPSIDIPNSVTEIDVKSFSGCEKLPSIDIPDSVIEIDDEAFSNCKSLESIFIPDSVVFIGDWAFEGCKSLKSIVIPDSVTHIGKKVFSGCDNLTIYCHKNSYADKYALKNNIPVKYID